ncbi:MAG: type I restriction endonuclease subunit R [Dissulfurispiraceae bacterium]
MDKHTERTFETEVCQHLEANGWLYSKDDTGYDRELAIFPEDVIGWLKDTQPTEFAKLSGWHNGDTEKVLLERLCKVMDTQGSLFLLRHEFKDHNARFQMCQFKPAHGLNKETADRCAKVRLRVMRQVHYSVSNEKSLDLVFFINGIPVATTEMKTDFTQNVHDAIKQYKTDRLPKDAVTKRTEPLLSFKQRALVHFALSSDEVYMTTRLEGAATRFLPFNLGNNGGAGNPANLKEGYRTSYFWERVLNRAAWLNIFANYVHLEKKEFFDKNGNRISKETIIFPRFHQWEAVTSLVGTVRSEGAGHTYLISHSAGSGKTNSISWLSHQLASLHDDKDNKIFESIIVITDRTVLDDQLQNSIYQIEHKHGVVCRITSKEGSKSSQLVDALVDSKPIIIVTLQTFPFVLEELRKRATLKKKRFAVVVDEAHSSTTGSDARKLRAVLTAEQIKEGVEVSAEDLLNAEMESRKQPKNVSFFAFTATPKAKTIELFGRCPDPTKARGPDNIPAPFHVYSMQQAIEEEFILDVLKNYTPYRLAYKLAHNGKEYDDKEVESSTGMKQLARWVRLHPYNIGQKVEIIVEHFRKTVAWRLNRQAKAMVVTGSRKEAVRYKIAIDAYIKRNAYQDIAALVAFSGDVTDPESGLDKFNEHNMNPALEGRRIADAFDTYQFNVLLVAEKFQTGFDQPKLVAMYVDKRIAGVNAVQTLSRLNRIYPGKDYTFVLDFVNDAEEIRESFEPYYRTAQLSGVSDPNVIHDLQAKLDATGIYLTPEIDTFIKAYFSYSKTQKDMQAAVSPAVDRFRGRFNDAKLAKDTKAIDALELFRKDLGTFIRIYDFLSQIVDYQDTDLESHYWFFKHLLPWLETGRLGDEIDLSSLSMTHYRITQQDTMDLPLGAGEEETSLKPITETGTGAAREKKKERLSQLIEKLNTLFEGQLSDADKITYVEHIVGKMMENETLAKQAEQNTKEQFGLGDFKGVFTDTIIEGLDNYKSMASQVLGNERVKQEFAGIVLDMLYERFKGGESLGQGRS